MRNTVDLIPISLVAQHVYCPRRAWLEAAGEKTDSYAMTAGELAHAATDDPTTGRGGRKRAIDVTHPGLGITGRADTVEDQNGRIQVVEYKATPVRRKAEVTPPMRVQLALQSACLREMGHDVSGCSVYFTTHRRRVSVQISNEDTEKAIAQATQTRLTVEASTAPEPLIDDPRCMGCSHSDVCLPEERKLKPVTRRIHAADPDGGIVHLATAGSRAFLRGGRLRVSLRGEEMDSLPLEQIAGLVLHGNIDLSSALIRELLWRGLTIVWCSGSGRVIGWSQTATTSNGLARVRQHQASAEGNIELAREFVAAKVGGQATLLRRNGQAPDTVAKLRSLQSKSRAAQNISTLTGIEGKSAALYFADLPTMLRRPQGEPFLIGWTGRVGRGAFDPLNVCLNFLYGVITAEVIRAIVACGLDPHAGFLHSSARNKPALALDLMEEFRAPLGDAVVLSAINNREITTSDFSDALGTWRLRGSGKRALLSAYERRVAREFTHPVFKYAITWRRAIEVQARMVLGYLDGSQSRYAGVTTR